MSEKEKLQTSLAAAGREAVQDSLRYNGLIKRHRGESDADFVCRIAAQFFTTAEEVRPLLITVGR